MMKLTDAANILGLVGEITPEIVKKAYRQKAKIYHPDVNADPVAGEKMMKIINEAFETLKEFQSELNTRAETQDMDYPEFLNDALNAIINLEGLEIEICGAWIWVGGNTREHKEILKTEGFKYASKKKKWNFRPEKWRSSSRGTTDMDDIRTKYGSARPAGGKQARIGGVA